MKMSASNPCMNILASYVCGWLTISLLSICTPSLRIEELYKILSIWEHFRDSSRRGVHTLRGIPCSFVSSCACSDWKGLAPSPGRFSLFDYSLSQLGSGRFAAPDMMFNCSAVVSERRLWWGIVSFTPAPPATAFQNYSYLVH